MGNIHYAGFSCAIQFQNIPSALVVILGTKLQLRITVMESISCLARLTLGFITFVAAVLQVLS